MTEVEAPVSSQENAPPTEAPDRLRRAEAVLQRRTGRLALVLEQCMDSHNHQAVLRTAEAMGIQYIYVINPNEQQLKVRQGKQKKIAKKITKNCVAWLTIRSFPSIFSCIEALHADGFSIWATDLSPAAVCLSAANKPAELPEKVAVVIGRESDGVSKMMLEAADKRVYLPMMGFTESFNLSVATALVLNRIFDWFPEIRGDLSEDQKQEIRKVWMEKLVNNPTALKEAQHWMTSDKSITPLEDLRRDTSAETNVWVARKIRKREHGLDEFKERNSTYKTSD